MDAGRKEILSRLKAGVRMRKRITPNCHTSNLWMKGLKWMRSSHQCRYPQMTKEPTIWTIWFCFSVFLDFCKLQKHHGFPVLQVLKIFQMLCFLAAQKYRIKFRILSTNAFYFEIRKFLVILSLKILRYSEFLLCC